jgi:hypothetical protein
MSALRELLAVFDIKVDDHELKEGHKHVEDFRKTLGEVAKTVGEAFAVKEVYEFVSSQIEAAARTQDLADRLDLSATAMSNFGFVAKGAGLDTESAARSLGFFQKTLGEATLKAGPARDTLKNLGIDVTAAGFAARPVTDVLADLADGIAKIPDKNQRAALSMQLLGREGRAMVPILAKGGDAMRDALKEADALGNGLGDDYFANAKKAREESEKLQRVIQSLKERAIAILLPAVTWLTSELKEGATWMLEHAKTTKVLEYAVGALAIAVGVGLVDALASAAVALWALMAPVLPFIIAAGALVWIFQDLYGLVQGDTSVIGDFIEALGGVGAKKAVVDGLREAWAELKSDIDAGAYALGYFVGVLIGTEKAIAGSPLMQSISDAFALVGIDIGDANVSALIFKATLEGIKDTIINMIPGLSTLILAGHAISALHGGISNDATAYGVPPEVAAAAGPWADPSKHPSPESATGTNAGQDTATLARRPTNRASGIQWGTPAPPPLRVHGIDDNDRKGGGVVVHQGAISVVVNTKSDRPKEVGDAVGAGVSSATQRDMRNALASAVTK